MSETPQIQPPQWAQLRRRVLVVCVGNRCRSPLAAGLLRARLPHDTWTIDSAGTRALEGQPATGRTLALADRHGIDLHAHRSVRLRAEHLRYYGYVLTMSRKQAEYMVGLEAAAAPRVRLLGAFAPTPNLWMLRADPNRLEPAADDEVGDPSSEGTDAHRAFYERLEPAVAEVAVWLSRGAMPEAAPPTADTFALIDRDVPPPLRMPANL